MKLTTAFCTLALATAAKQQDDSSQGAQSQGAQSEEPADAGYGGQAEAEQGGYQQADSYGAESSYSAPAVFLQHVENCFAGCPKHAPCMGAGGCQPKSCSAEAHYAAPVQSYGAQQSYGGGAQQSGYRRLQYGEAAPVQSYGEAAPVQSYAAPKLNCGCPAGSVDTSHLELQSNVILWVAFALLFLPSLFFLCRAFDVFDLTVGRTPAQIAEIITLPRVIAGVVTLVASLAYLTMATGHGYVVKCNGRQFYYARYVDWAITTPLMLWDLVTFGTASSTSTSGSVNLTRVFLVVMDVFMIVAGLIGELIEGGERWAFFGFSMLAFIPIMWFLCKLENDDGVCCGAAAGLTPESKLFQRILMITIITWSIYPIVWILATTGGTSASVGAPVAYAAAEGGYRALAEGGFTAVGVISVDAECWIYTVLDVIAKSVFGGVIVCWNWVEWFECEGTCKGCCSENGCVVPSAGGSML